MRRLLVPLLDTWRCAARIRLLVKEPLRGGVLLHAEVTAGSDCFYVIRLRSRPALNRAKGKMARGESFTKRSSLSTHVPPLPPSIRFRYCFSVGTIVFVFLMQC